MTRMEKVVNFAKQKIFYLMQEPPNSRYINNSSEIDWVIKEFFPESALDNFISDFIRNKYINNRTKNL